MEEGSRLPGTIEGGQRSALQRCSLRALIVASLLGLLAFPAAASPEIHSVTRGPHTLSLAWQGGRGPYVVETSRDLVRWSAAGDPVAAGPQTVRSFDTRSFYRVVDVDPEGVQGEFFGLIQTEQGEGGTLMARHRLKTRTWLHKTRGAPHTSSSYTPAEYWRKLIVTRQWLDDGLIRTWTGRLEQLGAVTTPNSQSLTVGWTTGTGASLRNWTLTLDFPYSVTATRTLPTLASDPDWTLRCTYATSQPELAFESPLRLTTTTADTTRLVQMDPANDPGHPDQSWWVRRYSVKKNGVRVDCHFFEGLPLYQGSPPWIFKTLLLDRWLSPTTFAGGSLPEFSLDSYFAQTLMPGHHNFYEIVLLEPALDPSLPESTRAALGQANIRQVYTFKDLAGVVIGGDGEDIRYFGYDNSIREP